ncbi:C40 family peptidase [Thiobacter aerophilum]|uniref:C40 family peptidase n=1 Tax=Thiobacter aerophilum TaxID=3121275 RepID=A0ABV0EAX8_9BURK
MAAKSHALVLILCTLALPCRAEPAQGEASRSQEPALMAGPTTDLTLYALSLNGTAYRYGGSDPEGGLDCSGFVGHVFREVAGIDLPRSAQAIAQLGRKIGISELKPGDLVFFNTLRRAFSHVGIYLGNQQFIHATSSRTGEVLISSLREAYWARRFDGARRIDLAGQ